jgi:hypothetical protein
MSAVNPGTPQASADVGTVQRGFDSRLASARRRWRAGMLAESALRLFVLGGCVLLGLTLADFFLMSSQEALWVLDGAAVATVALAVAVEGVGLLRASLRRTAVRADGVLADRRRSVLSAWELLRESGVETGGGLRGFLVEEAAREASAGLARLGARALWPHAAIRRWGGLALAVVIAGGLVLLPPTPLRQVCLARVLRPDRDLPPWSRFRFEVTPDRPSAVYGGTIEVRAAVCGASVRGPVTLVTRAGGRLHRAACFQEGEQRYAQRIERVVSPVDFCFLSGRARSRWHRVEVLLEPRIESAVVALTPPAYSGLARREFAAGQEDIRGLRDARVELRVTSNRPLSAGDLLIEPADGRAGAVVSGESAGEKTLAFRWTLHASARLKVTLRDVRGTTNAAPYALQQTLTPDEPPRAYMTDPMAFSLATPAVRVPMAGYAEDDLGLARVSLVRAVVGYRDRVRRLADPMGEKRAAFEQGLDLAALGVEPGDVIELYAEARDHNPDLTGIGVSDVRRIEIIGEKEYGDMLRVRATVDAFAGRFRTVHALMSQLAARHAETVRQLERGDLDEAAKRERVVELLERTTSLLAQFRHLADDFVVFDLERELKEALGDLVQNLEYNRQMLDGLKPSDADFGAKMARMLANLGGVGEKLAALSDEAEELAKLWRLMEQAAEFQRQLRRQASLVRRLSRFAATARTEDTALLGLLGRDQQAVYDGIRGVVQAIRERSQGLPPYAAELAADARAFADAIENCGALALMDEAAVAAKNQNGEWTHRKSALALERLQSLLKQCSGEEEGDPGAAADAGRQGRCRKGNRFGGLCNGSDPGLQAPPDLQSTLQQMLWAMRRRSGQGGGDGSGQGSGRDGGGTGAGGFGAGGDASDGYSMPGSSLLNVPIFGPQRTEFRPPSRSGMAAGGEGTGGVAGPAAVVSDRDVAKPGARKPVTPESLPIERVPEKYREAVKRYFAAGGSR